MSVSEFSPPPSPKSPATTVSSLSDASSDAPSRLFSDDWRDVGTIAGHTDLNTTVVSDAKLPLPTWEVESRVDYPIEEEEQEYPSPARSSRRRSPGAATPSSKRAHSRPSSSKSTPKPAVDVESVAFDDVHEPIDEIAPQPRRSERKRTRSSAGLGREPSITYHARTRKVSTRTYRRSSGEPRMNQVPVCESHLSLFFQHHLTWFVVVKLETSSSFADCV